MRVFDAINREIVVKEINVSSLAYKFDRKHAFLSSMTTMTLLDGKHFAGKFRSLYPGCQRV